MHRFSQLDSGRTRRLTILVVITFAIGLAALLGLSTRSVDGIPTLDVNSSYILSLGIALACFASQRSAYRTWRSNNLHVRTSSWLPALGWALIFTLLTAVVALPFYALVASMAHGSVGLVSG